MKRGNVYIERRPGGDYAIRKEHSKRASAVEPTQKAAIAKALELQPDAKPLVERVRNTKTGNPDKWRKP